MKKKVSKKNIKKSKEQPLKQVSKKAAEATDIVVHALAQLKKMDYLRQEIPTQYKEYTGVLDTHWETGMEDGILAHLYVDGFETKNPNYDKNNPKAGPEFFRSYDGMITLDFKDEIEIIDCPFDKNLNGTKYELGNRNLMAKYRPFGRVYPFTKDDSKFDVNLWYKLFQSNTKAKVRKLSRKVCLYGGTFDPIHNGHKDAIKQLTYQFDDVLVLVGNNWTKDYSPTFSLDERLSSVKAVTNNMLKVSVLDWAKTEDTSSTYKVADKIKSTYGITPHIVIGTDIVPHLTKWKYWDELKSFPFVVVERKGYPMDTALLRQLDLFYTVVKVYNEVSSSEIKVSHDKTKIPEEAQKCLDLRKLD